MISIEEKITEKCPGETSLFLTFPYKEEYLSIVKKCSGSNFSKKTKVWEVPLTYLPTLLDEFCVFDSVDLTLLPEKTEETTAPPVLQTAVRAQPFEHQIEAVQYGLTHDRWLLLHEPGLGKSLSLMYLAQELRVRGEVQHCLIICGLNTLKTNWYKEISKFTELGCTILGQRINTKGKRVIGSIAERTAHLKRPIEEFFVITNIETLRDEGIQKAILKGPNKFEMIVVDEIHACKSPQAAQSQGLLKLTQAKYRIGATGTLITSKPLDAFVPLKWLGIERSTYTNFKYYYGVFGGPFNNILYGFKNLSVLQDMISEHSHRRSKDLLHLPPKVQIDEYLDMEEKQAKLYENIKEGVKEEVDKIELNTSSLLALLGRLRQATSCPSALTTAEISSAKVDRACDLVEQITGNGEKVVIFSSFKETTAVLSRMLPDYQPLVCTGDTPDSMVSQIVDTFQTDPTRKVFIATWQKMGTGLTLTAASHVIFIDSPYTAAQKEQAEDRCHRIGTTSTVMVYNLITAGTVDERVAEIVREKEALSDYLVDGQITASQMQELQKYIQEL